MPEQSMAEVALAYTVDHVVRAIANGDDYTATYNKLTARLESKRPYHQFFELLKPVRDAELSTVPALAHFIDRGEHDELTLSNMLWDSPFGQFGQENSVLG